MDTDQLLSQAFLKGHPEQGARILERLPPHEAAAVLAENPPDVAAGILARIEPRRGSQCLEDMTGEQAGLIVSVLPLDRAAALLRRAQSEARERLLEHLSANVAAPLRRQLQYPESTAGALMDPMALALPEDLTVTEARHRLADNHVRYYLYVVSRDHRLTGVVTLRELMLAPDDASLVSIMRPQVARLSVHAQGRTIIEHSGWREFHALPVVDDSGIFVGVVRHETLRGLEAEIAKVREPASGAATLLRLGELYGVSFVHLLSGLIALCAPRPTTGTPAGER